MSFIISKRSITGEEYISKTVVATKNKLTFDILYRDKKIVIKIINDKVFIKADKLFSFENIEELRKEKELIGFNNEIIDFISDCIKLYRFYMFRI